MTITAQDATSAANYLATLNVLTLKGSEGPVWADYLNTMCPLITRADLQAATRRAVAMWAEMRRSYQIDAEHIRAALRKIHAERVKAANILPPRGLENEPKAEILWLAHVRDQVAVGIPLEQAEAHAWQAIGRTPPPLTPAVSRQHALTAAANTIGNPQDR